MREISILALAPLRIGQTENADAGTGCTVFPCEAITRAVKCAESAYGFPSARELGTL